MKKASIFLGILLSAFLFSMIIFKIIDINESKKMDFDSVKHYSLIIGIAAAIINLFIGVLYGGIAGFLGGRVDSIMMRIVTLEPLNLRK